MPIIVNELVIKATVEADGGDTSSTSSGDAGKIDTADLVEQCVEEVLRILRQREER